MATTPAIQRTWHFLFHMLQSLRRVFVGAAVAMILSIAVGIYMGTVLMGERFFQPLVVLGLTIPGLMWALIAVMLFGINEIASYFAVAVTAFPMLVINIWAGVKALDKELIDMSHVFRFTPWMKISQVIIPQLVPNIFAATRYGLGLAWKVVVVVEMFGTSNGVGYQVMKSYQIFNMEGVIAWTLTFVAAMIIIEYGIINLAERRLTAWRPKIDVWRRRVARLIVRDAGQFPLYLSGGQRQRVGLARALAIESDLVLMDEPFASVDELTARQLRQTTRRLCEQLHRTVLFVTHNLPEAAYMSDYVVTLTTRPARMAEVVSNPLPAPRNWSPEIYRFAAELEAKVTFKEESEL